MLFKSIKMQTAQMFGKKSTAITYLILFAAVLCNFFANMSRFKNGDITQMMCPMKLSALSGFSAVDYYIMQFYPLLLVLPTAECYFNEKNSRVCNYLQARVGSANYLFGKAVSVFLVAFVLFTVPFITEIIAYIVTVPFAVHGDPRNFEYFQTIEADNNLFWSGLYYFNKYLYTVVLILIFGVVTSVFAVFNFSLTTLKVFKFRVFTYFPIYILFYLIEIVSKLTAVKFETRYHQILPLFFVPVEANYPFYFAFCICLLLFSASLLFYKSRKGEIV